MTTKRYLEDFAVGDIDTFNSRPMSHEEIIAFGNSWDPQRLHTNVEYATALHGTLIASGFQTLLHVFEPIVRGVLAETENIGGMGFEHLRWPRPTRPDESLTVKFEITEVRPSRSKPDRGVLRYDITAYNPAGEEVFLVNASTMLKRCPERANDPS